MKDQNSQAFDDDLAELARASRSAARTAAPAKTQQQSVVLVAFLGAVVVLAITLIFYLTKHSRENADGRSSMHQSESLSTGGDSSTEQQNKPIALLSREATATDHDLDTQLKAAQQQEMEDIATHRKALESLFDELRQACLSEPEPLQATGYAQDLEEWMLSTAQSGSPTDWHMIEEGKRVYLRTTTQAVVERLAGEAHRRADQITRYQKTLADIEAQRPAQRLADAWSQGVISAHRRRG